MMFATDYYSGGGTVLDIPKTLLDIEALVNNRVQESLHLDYKASEAAAPGKKDDIAKDVSAFANSDGGMIIYGVEEGKDHFPTRIDGGVDHSTFSHERLEQTIHGNITPRIDGLRIYPIPVSASRSIYVVQVPPSYRGPHQASDKKYYKRFNFLSTPMEDYEIGDVRNRRTTAPPPLVTVDIRTKGRTAVFLVVSNIGRVPAEDVSFTFSKELKWYNQGGVPRLFKNGVKYLPPGRNYYFLYNTFGAAFNEATGVASNFDVEVSYVHPQVNRRISDVFHIDLLDYQDSTEIDSEELEVGKKIVESIGELKNQVGKLNEYLECISSISGATGLTLSVPTLKNLGHLLAKDGEVEKIDPVCLRAEGFKELLEIGDELAYQLAIHFRTTSNDQKLCDLPGMTNEIMQKFRKLFVLASDE